jgi:hypothetical protein
MPALLTAALIAGGAAAASGIAKGVGEARAGKKMRLTDAEARELEELERRKAAGELGLDERQRGSIEQQFLAEQAGASRELEAAALQQAAARGLSGSVSGREVFLQEQAEAGAKMAMRQEQNIAVQRASQAEARAEEARIDAMTMQQKKADAMRAQGIANAVSGGLAGVSAGAQMYGGQQAAIEKATIEAGAKQMTSEELFNMLNSAPVVDAYGQATV